MNVKKYPFPKERDRKQFLGHNKSYRYKMNHNDSQWYTMNHKYTEIIIMICNDVKWYSTQSQL